MQLAGQQPEGDRASYGAILSRGTASSRGPPSTAWRMLCPPFFSYYRLYQPMRAAEPHAGVGISVSRRQVKGRAYASRPLSGGKSMLDGGITRLTGD
jgi:hypothetical protein